MPLIPPGHAVLYLDPQTITALATLLTICQRSSQLRDDCLKHLLTEVSTLARQQWKQAPPPYQQPDMGTRTAASFLGVSVRRIQQLAKSGELPSYRVANGNLRFTYDNVIRYKSLSPLDHR